MHKYSRECWLQWINWEAYLFSKYLLCYSLSSTHVLMPCVNDTFLLSWFINNSNQANLWLLWSDATCRSVIWWVFSLCKFSLVDPAFVNLKVLFFCNNVIQRKLIALNNKGTRVAHFFSSFHAKKIYMCIWLPCIWAYEICLCSYYMYEQYCMRIPESEWVIEPTLWTLTWKL